MLDKHIKTNWIRTVLQKETLKTKTADMILRASVAVPSFVLRIITNDIAVSIAEKHPELFDRMGEHSLKTFLIDPVDMAYVFVLMPDKNYPSMEPVRRCDQDKLPNYDAKISGKFVKLLEMLEGKTDGDSIFFSRELLMEGDTEAVLALRNALDDIESNPIDDIISDFGIFSYGIDKASRLFR